MSTVLYEVSAGIATIRLNRPDRLNAISQDLVADLNAAFVRAAADPAVSVIVLGAEGRAFCAGDDLFEFVDMEALPPNAPELVEALQDVSRHMMFGDKPVVCAVQGWAVGGGATWLLNADFLVVADDAIMFCPEASYGLFCTGGMTVLLPERCGPETANRILWTGERVNATRMVELGFTREIAPRAELAERARALALRIAALPAVSRRRYKQARNLHMREILEKAMAFESQCCLDAASDPEVRDRIREESVVGKV
jgi:enoyl-CoA hydratase/carnithine racemase